MKKSEVNLSTDLNMKNQMDWLKSITIAVVTVLFIGFAGMFVAVGQMMVDSLTGERASYSELQKTVEAQNVKIEELTKALQDEQKTIQKTD